MSIQREQTEARCDTLADIVLSMDSLQTLLEAAGRSSSASQIKAAVKKTEKLARSMSQLIQSMTIDKQNILRDQKTLASDQDKLAKEAATFESMWANPGRNKVLGELRSLTKATQQQFDLLSKLLPSVKTSRTTASEALAEMAGKIPSLARNESVSQVKAAVDTLARKPAGLAQHQSMCDVKKGIDNLGKELGGLARGEPVHLVQTAVDDLAKRVACLARDQTVQDVKKMMSFVAEAARSLGRELPNLAQVESIEEIRTAIDSLAQSVASVAQERSVSDINTAIDGLAKLVAREQCEVKTAVDSLAQSVAGVTQERSVGDINAAIDSMAKSVAREHSVCEVKTAINGMARSVAREQSVCEARTAINSLAASLSGVAREQSVNDTIAAVYNVAEMLNNLEGAQLAIGSVVQKVYHLAEGQSANAADRLAQDETLSSSVSDLRTHVNQGFQANLQAIDSLSRCIAKCASSKEETPNPMVNKLNEIRQAIPTEKHLQRLLGDELRTVGEAVQETLKLDQLDTLLNERFEGVAKSLAADLDQLQASLAKDGRDVISDMAAQKGQLELVVEGSDHMSKALSGVQRDIETVGIRVEDAQLAAAEAAETAERVVQTVHHQASAVTDAFRQIKAHFDQVFARQEAEELGKARCTIASLERELSRSRDDVLQLKAADHARAAEVDHLRAALERSENNVSKLGDRVDRLARADVPAIKGAWHGQ